MTREMKEVICEQAMLGESPMWDEQSQLFYWVDILGQFIHEYNPKTKRTRSIKLDQMPGAVAPSLKTGTLIAALQHGFYFIDFDHSSFTAVSDPEKHKPNTVLMMESVTPQDDFGQVLFPLPENRMMLLCIVWILRWKYRKNGPR
nr:SMP-30/gluconolactonase/LRE family protein [Sinobaca sp. H24]